MPPKRALRNANAKRKLTFDPSPQKPKRRCLETGLPDSTEKPLVCAPWNVVKINAGGRRLETSTNTLLRQGLDSKLAKLLRSTNVDEHGVIFVDSDGAMFEALLRRLRLNTGEDITVAPPVCTQEEWNAELRRWGIECDSPFRKAETMYREFNANLERGVWDSDDARAFLGAVSTAEFRLAFTRATSDKGFTMLSGRVRLVFRSTGPTHSLIMQEYDEDADLYRWKPCKRTLFEFFDELDSFSEVAWSYLTNSNCMIRKLSIGELRKGWCRLQPLEGDPDEIVIVFDATPNQ